MATFLDAATVQAARLLGADDELTVPGDDLVFPAGVVALGRGGAGEAGALLRQDGSYVGLLCLEDAGAWESRDVAALADALPGDACQVVSVRWPVDLERQLTGWRLATRGDAARAALAADIASDYLPLLHGAGWSALRTLLAIFAGDPDTLRHDLSRVAQALPGHWRPCTLTELKALAGDWFEPLANGQAAIGWSVTELSAAPRADWMRALLEDPALASLPVTASLLLGPPLAGAEPSPVALQRRLTELDARIEMRRRAGRYAGGGDDDLVAARRVLLARLAARGDAAGPPRDAQLLLGCIVDRPAARQVRAEVETVLRGLGFIVASIGPGRGAELLLSCAPLGEPVLGQPMTLTTLGAALLAPVAPRRPAPPAALLPLGLYADGGGALAADGEHLLLVGESGSGKSSAACTWALSQAAVGVKLTVVDTGGSWSGVALAAGGVTTTVAERLGALLGDLAFGTVERVQAADRAAALDRWVTDTAALLGDLCPTLSDDDRGDLTGFLLGLADDHLAGRDVVHLHRLIQRLGAGGSAALAEALAALVTPSSARTVHAAGSSSHRPAVTVYTTTPAQTWAPAGLAATAVLAALDDLRALPRANDERIVVVDDLAAVLAAHAGLALVLSLLREAERVGATVWCLTSAFAQLPLELSRALRALRPAGVLFRHTPDETRALARWFDVPQLLLRDLPEFAAGEARLPRDGGCDSLRVLLNPLIARLNFQAQTARRRSHREQPDTAPAFAYGA